MNGSNILCFFAGAVIGFGVSTLFFKKKYEQKALDDIREAREIFHAKNRQSREKEDADTNMEIEPDEETVREYNDVVQKTNYNLQYQAEPLKEIDHDAEPYVISPEEYGEIDEYTTIEAVYYEDGSLIDSKTGEEYNISETIGGDAINHFGEYEDDAVYIRNDHQQAYYAVFTDDTAG